MQRKLLSIITPNYNYASFISKTIESVVVEQDYDNIEHIIIDDGSKDNSIEIIGQYLNKYPTKIKLIEQENQGHVKAVNVGFKYAKGDIVGWINSDDFYCDKVFSKIIKLFEDDKIEIIFGDYNIVDIQGRYLYKNKHLEFDYKMGMYKGFAKILTSNAIFWKRKIFDRIGYLDESIVHTPDNEFFARLTFGANIKKINIPLANYRKHPNTMTHSSSLRNKKEINLERKKVFNFAYSKTSLTNFLPIKYARMLKPFYLCKRMFLRTLKGHYFSRLCYYFIRS